MKKIYTFILLLASAGLAQSQCSVTVASSTHITCYGLSNGSATLTSVGTPNFTYLWSPGGQTVPNPTNLSAGTNTVVMTDGTSCSAAAAVTISEPSPLIATTTQTHISACDASCSATATVAPAGGTGTYTHLWSTSPAQYSSTAIGLCDAIYTDIITDANGCSITRSVTIEAAPSLNISLAIMNTSGAITCDGSALSSVAGGVGTYSYHWYPGGQITSSIINQCPGKYSVCVTDADGCQVCDSFSIASPLGITEIQTENELSVFPNPSDGRFNVQVKNQSSNTTISIVNALGEQVFNSKLNTSQFNIDLSSLNPGIYFVKVADGKKITTKRIVFER